MPDPAPTKPVHFITSSSADYTACRAKLFDAFEGWERVTTEHGRVTCFLCRNSTGFKLTQRGVEPPTPLPQRQTPRLLRDIVADSIELRDIIKQGLNAGTNDAEHEALTQLADHFGLTYNEDTNTYT
jgi:hypothetical protein